MTGADMPFLKAFRHFGFEPALPRYQAYLDDTSPDPFGLTADERIAIWLYTGSGDLYARINGALWSNVVPAPMAIFVATLRTGLRKLPKLTGTAFRGAPVYGSLEAFIEIYRPGREIVWPAFSSAAREMHLAYRSHVLFVIASTEGRSVQGYGTEAEQGEIIFLPGSKFSVSSIIERSASLTELETPKFVVAMVQINGDPHP